MLRKLGIGFIALATMAPGLAAALGVGEYELNSYLNEPLDMTVQLHDLGGLSEDEILANLATQEAFDAAGVNRGYFLNDLKFEVDVSGDTGVLHIHSRQPVREPYLNFLVEFLWPTGRLMREYTVLLDPPSYAASVDSLRPAVSQPSQRPATRPESDAEPARASAAESATRPAPARTGSDGDAGPSDRDGAGETQTATTYRVRPSDTMWDIARRQRPSAGVSVQQMMLAIQERNPDAFIDNNVNLVREGAVLRIPSERQARRLSSREALSRVASQNREWRSMRREPAVGQPQRAPIDATGRDRSDQVAGGDGRGTVTLVSPDSKGGVRDGDATGGRSGDANTAALQNELAIRDENLDRLKRENSELRSRLNALDEQVSTSQRLLEMRSEKIAALQAELRRLREEQNLDVDPSLLEEPVAAEDSAPDMAADADGADSDDVDSTDNTDDVGDNEPPAAGGDDGDAAPALGAPGQNGGPDGAGPSPDEGGGGDDRTATVTPPEKPEPASADRAGSRPASADQADSGGILGLIRDNLLYVGAALAVLLLLLLLALRRRQNQNTADDEQDDADDDVALSDDFEAPAIAGAAAHDDADLEEDLADDEMDPMERADVYVAYGQYPQAVDFLRNEINQAPERGDLKIRLLELLHESNDERGFQQQATAFAGTSPAVDAAIKRLGGDPGEHDYGDNAYVTASADKADDELSLDDLELDLASDLSDQPDDNNDYAHAATATAAGAGAAAGFAAGREQSEQTETEQTDQDDSLELDDFDFTLEDEEPENRPLRDETPLELDDLVLDSGNAHAGDDEDDGLEFSLEDDFESDSDVAFTDDELAALDSAEAPAAKDDDDAFAVAGDDTAERGADDDLGDFDDLQLDDLDVSLTDDRTGVDEPAPAPVDPSPGEEADDELADLSLEDDDTSLSLDDISLEDETPSPSRTEPDAGADDLDDLNLELDDAGDDAAPAAEHEPEPQTAATPSADTGEVSDDMLGDDDDFDFLGETDENATKLDLARAYIDMGDAEGARDILNEVLSEGSDEQQGEAKELLSRVS